MRFCRDCECCRPDQAICNKGFPQGQLNCPEFEEKDKWLETCEDCVHFDVRDHKMFCKYIGASMASDNRSGCIRFKNKKLTVEFKPHNADALDTMLYAKWNTERKEYNKMFKMDKVKKVIFNPPATIVCWFDGTKTIVKVQDGELFDKEKGFAMACAKKFFGNKGNYYDEFRKHGADNHCYSVHIDLGSFENRTGESIAKDVKSAIEDDKSPNEIRELVGLPPIRDIHEAAMPSAIREELEKSELDRNRNIKIKDVLDRLKRFVDDRKLGIYTSKNSTGCLMKFEGMINGKKQAYNHHISNVELDTYMTHRIASHTEYLVNAWYVNIEIEGSKLAEAIEESE